MPLKKLILKILFLLILLISVGTSGYILIEGWNFVDALFMSVETMTTVGYGFVHPLSEAGRIFTIIYILFGVTLFLYMAAEFANTMTSFNLEKIIRRQNMEKKMKKFKNHFILCGYGRTGIEIATQLRHNKMDFVIIDKDPAIEQAAQEMQVPYIIGEATEDETLNKAGIAEAKGLLCALSDDVDNLYLTLSARNLNPQMIIVTRCIKSANEVKFKKAGATKVILPYEISGRRMVSSIIKPDVTDFLDVVVHTKAHELELEMEQYNLCESSAITNRTIYDSEIRQKTGIIIIAIKRGEKFITSPPPNTILQANDCLIILGTTEQLTNFEQFAKQKGD